MIIKRVSWVIVLVLAFFGIAQAEEFGQHEFGHHKIGYGHGGHARGEYGRTDHHGHAGHFLHHLLKHQKELELTEEQVSKLKTLSLDLDRTMIRTKADILVAERELKSMVHDEKADLTSIEAKVKESGTLEVRLRMAAIKAKREAWTLLTPEQREKEKAEREKRMRHYQEG